MFNFVFCFSQFFSFFCILQLVYLDFNWKIKFHPVVLPWILISGVM